MNDKVLKYLSIVAGAFMLMSLAFANHYPLLCPDSSTYIVSGFEFKPPFDRPITYGLFIWLSSLGGQTLWLTIFIQSFILSFLIYFTANSFLQSRFFPALFVVLITALSFATPLGWITSMLMSDVFTPICCLSLIALLSMDNKQSKLPLYGIFFLANAMHMSNVLISVSLIIPVAAFTFKRQHARFKTAIIALVLALSGIALMGSAISKSSSVFMAGSMVETGIMKEVLEKNCESNNYKLCAYKDSLNMSAVAFLWEEKSPLHQLGGWQANRAELESLVKISLQHPYFLWLHVKASFVQTFRQLNSIEIGEGSYRFSNEKELLERITRYVPADKTRASGATQFNEGILTISGWFNIWMPMAHWFLILISIGLMVYTYLKHQTIHPVLLMLYWAMLANTVICAILANPSARLGGRMFWVPALIVVIFMLNKWHKSEQPDSNS